MAAWIMFVLAAYRLATQLTTPLQSFLKRHSNLPLAAFIINLLFFWLLTLLWVAYRKWREALVRQQELEKMISAISPDVLLLVDRHRTIVMSNGAVDGMFGYEPEELAGKKTDTLYFDRRVSGQRNEIYQYLERVGFHIGFATGRRKSGVTFPIEIITGNIKDQSGVVTLIRDITARSRAEDALRESEERFSLFMRYLPASAYIKDPDGRIVYMNEHFAKSLGCDITAAMGKKDTELLPDEIAQQVKADDESVLTKGKILHRIEKVPREGSVRLYDTFKFPIPRGAAGPLLGGVSVDITDRRRAEEERRRLEMQMLQSQKLESLGLLGGGIAHDFNNLLAGILGYADLALTDLSPSAPAYGSVKEVVDASKRAAELCNQLLAYSGQGRFVIETINLSALVNDMKHLLEVSLSKKAELRLKLLETMPAVECDATQIRQVVMNLALNASESLGDTPGMIQLATGVMKCTREQLADAFMGETLSAGSYAFLRVADNGSGMDDETLAKIFDPFFTTKFTGRGLGLAAVMGIVRGHEGAISVKSEHGAGTTFTVLLPASKNQTKAKEPQIQKTDDWTSSGKVLVVDDEEIVRAIAGSMLEKLGFKVITAANGESALRELRDNTDVKIVLMDMTMPDLGGMDVYERMRKLGIAMPVIFTSGYNKEHEIEVLPGMVGFLQKPFQLGTMRERFKEMLRSDDS